MKHSSLLHTAYACYLSTNQLVESFDYNKAVVDWQDNFTGQKHKLYCHFRIRFKDGHLEHVQVEPLKKQMPLTKYLYAENNLENWRWISKEELNALDTLENLNPTTIPKRSFCINFRHRQSPHLDLNKILILVKQNLTASEIAKSFSVSVRRINSFLHRKSYYVIWAGHRNISHEIYCAGQKQWPT